MTSQDETVRVGENTHTQLTKYTVLVVIASCILLLPGF